MSTEYKFPDEAENAQGQVADATPEFEIEVDDDTPQEDRNREPMPRPLVEELEEDDLDKYDDLVKQRLKQMRKVWHDERREKEAAVREHQEAIHVAQRLLQENQQLKGTVQAGLKEYVEAIKLTASTQMEQAKRAYKDAYDAGDTDALVEAQTAMQQAQLRMAQIANFRPPIAQHPQNVVQSAQVEPQASRPDRKALAWQERNQWFGTNKGMTAFALGVHDELRGDGVEVGSDQYYATLDKTVRERFPEAFGEQGSRGMRTKSSTVVASASRSTAPQKVRLSQSQMNLISKLGITPEQYVREFVKEQRNGR